jgi:chromosomal replication initiation ATPase DnaA
MNQLTFKFPFKTNYYEEDFYVSSNNFEAYKLIESWPNWPSRFVNIFGPSGCGKTHLSTILKKKLNSFFTIASELNDNNFINIKSKECLIIDDYNNNIEEKLLYTVLNQCLQSNQYVIINSIKPIKKIPIELIDLRSRLESFTDIGIDLPTDDLIRVILTKSFSDKQVKTDIKLLEYILKNINRSYEEIFNFIEKVDLLSLSTGKPITINLIKKILINEQI